MKGYFFIFIVFLSIYFWKKHSLTQKHLNIFTDSFNNNFLFYHSNFLNQNVKKLQKILAFKNKNPFSLFYLSISNNISFFLNINVLFFYSIHITPKI